MTPHASRQTAMQHFAAALLTARNTSECFSPAADSDHPLTEAEAYAVQATVARRIGKIAGFKAGPKSGTGQTFAPLMASGLYADGAVIRPKTGGMLGVELEIGLRLNAPLPPRDAPDFADRLRDSLSLVAVIEIVAPRVTGPLADQPLVKLADFQINAGLVIGTGVPAWNGTGIGPVNAQMRLGDQVLLDGPTQVPGGDAFDTLLGVVDLARTHFDGLQPGHVIITGSLHPLTYVPAGTLVKGRIDGVGTVSVQIG